MLFKVLLFEKYPGIEGALKVLLFQKYPGILVIEGVTVVFLGVFPLAP